MVENNSLMPKNYTIITHVPLKVSKVLILRVLLTSLVDVNFTIVSVMNG